MGRWVYQENRAIEDDAFTQIITTLLILCIPFSLAYYGYILFKGLGILGGLVLGALILRIFYSILWKIF